MKTNWGAVIAIATITSIAFSVGDFIHNPEKYGDVMRRFDEARFGGCEVIVD